MTNGISFNKCFQEPTKIKLDKALSFKNSNIPYDPNKNICKILHKVSTHHMA